MPGTRSGSRSSGAAPARVTFHVEGGFAHLPGLAQPREIDPTTLPASDAATLRTLIEGAAPVGRPARDGSAGADCRTYVLTVESAGGRRRTVTLSDPIADAAVARLIARLSSAARRPMR